MLKIVTVDKNAFHYQPAIFLTDTIEVEREFINIVNWHKKAFWDKNSLDFMETIDTAKRKGDYGVITDMGTSCISCLSTGCKFGLLVLYFQKRFPSTKVFVKMGVAGRNVWEWLADNVDLRLYIFKENMHYGFALLNNIMVFHEGKIYGESNREEFWHMAHACEYAPYTMTKEAEKRAYKYYEKHRFAIACNLKEELMLMDFIKRFPNYKHVMYNENEETHDFKDFRVINYCNYIPEELPFRRHPLYVCGKRVCGLECRKINSVKYPKFLELLFYDVLNGGYPSTEGMEQEYCYFHSEYEMWFVLVLNGDELCLIKDYPKETIMGIEVDMEGKSITIHEKEKAVERFHALYAETIHTYD